MATSFNLIGPPQFPNGTSVAAYPRANWNGPVVTTAAPVGSATETKTVTGGVAAFVALASDTRYVAYALVGGVHKYTRFSTLLDPLENLPAGGNPDDVLTRTAEGATWTPSTGDSLVIENVVTTDYTLALSDAGEAVVVNSASAHNVTVPPNSSVAFPIGTVIEVYRRGAGSASIVAGAGVTFEPAGTWAIANQHSAVLVRKNGTDSWVIESAAGASSLAGLSDVNASTPSDKQGLIFDTASSKWIPATRQFRTQSDVDWTSFDDGDVPAYDVTADVIRGRVPTAAIAQRRTGVIIESMARVTVTDNVSVALGTPRFGGPIPLWKGVTYSQLGFLTGTTALGTPTHWWFALTDLNGVVLAVTADQLTTAWAAATEKVLSFTAAYVPVADESAYAMVCAAGAVAPNIVGATVATKIFQSPPVLGGSSTTTGMTTPPAVGATLGIPATGSGGSPIYAFLL